MYYPAKVHFDDETRIKVMCFLQPPKLGQKFNLEPEAYNRHGCSAYQIEELLEISDNVFDILVSRTVFFKGDKWNMWSASLRYQQEFWEEKEVSLNSLRTLARWCV